MEFDHTRMYACTCVLTCVRVCVPVPVRVCVRTHVSTHTYAHNARKCRENHKNGLYSPFSVYVVNCKG